MARAGKQTQAKRLREKNKQEKRQKKLERRADRKEERVRNPAPEGSDIAYVSSILPGIAVDQEIPAGEEKQANPPKP